MLTGARYGALLTFDISGGVRDFYTAGLSAEQRDGMTDLPQGLGLLAHVSKAKSPVRLKNMSTHPESVGLPQNHPPMKTFLGMPIFHRGEHVGNIYLTEKEGGEEFSQQDEDMAAMFAAQAASVIANVRRYEAEHQAKTDMETLMDICPVAVSVFDVRAGELSYMNRESRRLIGVLTPPGTDVADVFLVCKFTRSDGKELSFAELPGTRALQSGETVNAEEIIIHHPDGTKITTLVSCAPIFSGSGEIVSVLNVMQDLTPLDDVERQKAEFLGKVSEELRTPLTTIKGSAGALRNIVEEMQPNESAQLLRIIDQQADLMRTQINTLTELTQIETGTLSVAAEPADVALLLERSCAEYLREHASISIRLDAQEGLATVFADRQRICKVLHNFLRQAGIHSSDSSPVTVSATMVDIYVAISVSVKGPFARPETTSFPISATEHPELYKNVTRAHTKAAELFSPGESLATAFCRGVVEAHGGRMRTVIDEEEGRLTMTFTLPTVEDVMEPIPPKLAEPFTGPAPVPTDKERILVSIEEPRLLGTVRKILHNASYTPVAAYGLDEIEELALNEEADLLLLDITGREEKCFQLMQRVWDLMRIPVIVLCDRNSEDYVVRAFDMGAEGYVVKPFSPSELSARIRASLRKRVGGPQSAPSKTFQLGAIRVNFDERTVTVSGQPVQLTATEYKLLTELSNSVGRVLTQDELLQRVWGPEYAGEPQLLRSYVKSLRQKLGDNARKPTYIFTEHGIGYRMAKTVKDTPSGLPSRYPAHGDSENQVIQQTSPSLVRNGSLLRGLALKDSILS